MPARCRVKGVLPPTLDVCFANRHDLAVVDLRVSSLFALTLLLPNLSWAGEAEEGVETLPEESLPEIYGGTPTPICGWPTTVSLGGCTGTLVHPRVVVYAAHCGGNQNSVAFGENAGAPAFSVGTEYCQTNPAYNGGSSGRDQAFCVLSQSLEGIPIVPPLMGCETGVLTGGQEVTIVGFGQADAVPQYGLKRNVTTTINGIYNDEAYIGGGGEDSCQGDSGGPVYVRLSSDVGGDDTWRVFGITSYGGACGGGGYYSMMHTQMSWFESASGIDLTPCFTAEGAWQPGPECGFFPKDSQNSNGTWANGCAGGGTGAWSSICGQPFNSEPDNTPPTVTFVTPDDGAQFDSQGVGSVDIDVVTDAQDGDGWGVASVELYIDGALIDTDTSAPFEWNLKFPSGVYQLTAIAVDIADNASPPAVINIGVDDTPPADSGGDSGGASGGDSGGDSDGIGDSGGTGGIGANGDEGDSGCGCDVGGRRDSGGPLGLALFALGGLAWTRRRRPVR